MPVINIVSCPEGIPGLSVSQLADPSNLLRGNDEVHTNTELYM